MFYGCSYFQASNLLSPSMVYYNNNRDDRGRFLVSPPRGYKGRFISVIEDKEVLTLTKDVLDSLTGSLLGVGSLRFQKRYFWKK